MPNRPYTITQQPVVKAALAGTTEWAKLCCQHSNGSLWNNGTFVNRDIRNRPGTISNHARGLAMDLSYRWLNQKELGKQDGRKTSLAFIIKCLQNADHLGIQLVIDYQLQRSWRCDRGTWKPLPSVEQGDWYHIEIEPLLAHNPDIVKARFNAVFGAFPTSPPKPV
jgi:hypothetical protein